MTSTLPKSAHDTLAVLALGSNLGERLANLRFAAVELALDQSIQVERISSVYETEAHLKKGSGRNDGQSPDFLNAVLLISTSLRPRELLDVCQRIEVQCGRDPVQKGTWEPRLLDIDIVLFGQERLVSAELVLPHPKLSERRFVLAPLFEIAPDLNIPFPIDRSVQYLLDHCADTTRILPYPERLIEPSNQ